MVEEEEVMAMVMATDVEVRAMVVPLSPLVHVPAPAAVVTEEASLLWILNKGVKLQQWEAELLTAEEEEMVTAADVEVRGMVVPLTLLTHAQVSTAVATEEALPLWTLNKGEK